MFIHNDWQLGTTQNTAQNQRPKRCCIVNKLNMFYWWRSKREKKVACLVQQRKNTELVKTAGLRVLYGRFGWARCGYRLIKYYIFVALLSSSFH
jgi:hypothetical protein